MHVFVYLLINEDTKHCSKIKNSNNPQSDGPNTMLVGLQGQTTMSLP